MNGRRVDCCSRREFLTTVAMAGTAALWGFRSEVDAAEPPPETKRIRLVQVPSICLAPQYAAEDVLRSEGFTDVAYVKKQGPTGIEQALATGEADINMHFAGPLILRLEAGDPLVILAGVHIGCFELFGTERVRAVRDLKGKTVGIPVLGSPAHVFLSILTANVGLNPRTDIKWVTMPSAESMQLLAERKIDAFLGFPPEPQELRAKKIGHVVVNSMMDRPWSQYFCCMVTGNREFVSRNPIATKRALRAILKATDMCAREPQRAARVLIDKVYTKNSVYSLQPLKDIPYGKWIEDDPEVTIRLY
jgi:NitT/TauT family transport system substrate-binding protein